MPYPFAPGEVLTALNLNAALDMRMLASMGGMGIIPGAVVFGHASSGGFQTDSAGLFYDDVNNRLGIGSTTPQVQFHVSKVGGASLRSYNSYVDPGNGSWAYLGDWTKVTGVATYGTDKGGSGVVTDVSFLRGGVEQMKLGAYGLTATVASMVYTQPLPVLLGTATVAAAVRGVAVMGNYAYTTNQSTTGLVDVLEVFDVTVPTAPFKIAGLILPNMALGNPVIFGHYLYIGINSLTAGLQIIDISDPKRPEVVGTYNPAGVSVQAITLSGSYLYTGYGSTNATFRIIDISNPVRPTIVSTTTLTGASGTRSIVVQGKYAYVGTGQAVVGVGGLYVVDISIPTAPTFVTYNTVTTVSGIAVTERYLYTNQNVAASGFEVVDISDPLAPTLVLSMPATGAASAASEPIIAGSFLFKANNSANGIQVFNISNPAAPTSVGVIGTVAGAIGTVLHGNRLYVMANAQLRIYDTFGIDAPTARIGALGTDRLYVDGYSFFNSDIYAQRGLMVGEVLSRGRVSASEIDTLTVSGPAQDYIQGQWTMSGGGTITWVGQRLKWTQRIISIPMGRSGASSAGYVQFDMPVVDIPAAQVHNGVARSVDANGVLLQAWEALYAEHTVGGSQVAITYRIVVYGTAFIAPSNWFLIALMNGDTTSLKLGSGVTIYNGGSYTASLDQYVRINPAAPQAGSIALRSGTVRNYNIYTDAANNEWSYLGEFSANIALYGSDALALTDRDVHLVRGGTPQLLLESTGVRIGDSTKFTVGQLGGSANIATTFGVRCSTAIGTLAGDYLYPFEYHAFAAANVVRLQTALRRRTAGSAWQGTGYRIQYAVDNSFTDGSKSYVEIGTDTASGTGFIALGTVGLDRLTIPSTGIVSMPYGLISGAAVTVTAGNVQLNNGYLSTVPSPPSLQASSIYTYSIAVTASTALAGGCYLDAASAFKYRLTTGATAFNNDAGVYIFYTAPPGTIGATAVFTNRFSIGNTGLVGINGIAFAANDASSSGYNKVYAGDGTNIALYLGGIGLNTNYYRNTTHTFTGRDQDGSPAMVTITTSGISLTGSLSATGAVSTNAGLAFNDRTTVAKAFQWYSDVNIARLWTSAAGDILGVRHDNGYIRLGSNGSAGNVVDIYRAAFNDPLTILADSNRYARIVYNVSTIRVWSAGCLVDGTFGIGDETAGVIRFQVLTNGQGYFGAGLNVAGIYQSNGRAMSTVDATHHYLYRPDGGTALYLSNDTGTTNYYRANIHTFDHSNATARMTIDAAGAVSIIGNNLYFPNGNTIVLNNNSHYFGKDTAGTFHAIIGMLNDNQIHIAYGGQTILARGWLYTYGHITPNTTNTQYCGTAALAWFNCTAYGFPNVSDWREKSDIRTLPDRCLDLVRDIIPKRFKWNHGPDQTRSHWGFIAQEVAETMSKAGHEFGGHQVADDEKQTETLAVNELVAVLWGAVRELSAKVELLEAKGST